MKGDGDGKSTGSDISQAIGDISKLTFRPADVFYNFANVNCNGVDANCDGDGNGNFCFIVFLN